VVHRNTRLIAAYTAAAYGGAVCAIITTVLLIWMIRRSRRDRRQAPTFAPAPQSPFQAPPWAPAQAPPPPNRAQYPDGWSGPR
jgi:hypothetical protein